MDKLQALKVFTEVAKQQSFSLAAQTLDISAPVVTRTIAALESDLGVKLFNRTTRVVRLTDSGTRYLHDIKNVINNLQEAEDAARGIYAKPTGRLTVTAPVLFGEKYLVPIVSEYLATHENVSVNLVLYDRVASLLEEEIDVAIRIGHLKDSSLYATTVGEVRKIACAAPGYLARKGTPKHPQELTSHDIIFPTAFESNDIWQFSLSGKQLSVKLTPRLHCNQNAAALDAVLHGFGITRLMSYQIGEKLSQGKVQSVLTGFEEAPIPVSVVHVEGRRANAKIRTFIDLAVKRLSGNPYINPKG